MTRSALVVDTGPVGGPQVPPAACKLTGSWSLKQVRCGSADITADYRSVHVTTELRIRQDPGGGCEVEAIVASDSCEQRESWSTGGAFGAGIVEREGITSCAPSGCRFSPAHQVSCQLGARAEADLVSIVDVVPGHVVFEGLFEELVPRCGGALKMAFGNL